MTDLITHDTAAFSYLPGSSAFSVGALAAPGWAVDELRLARPLPLAVGLGRVVDVLADRGLGAHAIVGLELRSPEAVDVEGFATFNAGYQDLLAARGLIGGGANPVTRTNAVPDGGSLHERSIVAAQVVRPDPGGSGGDWVLSGVAELLADGTAVAAGDLSDAGMAAKAAHVLDVVAERLAALGAGTANVVNVYCPQDLGPLYDQVAARVPAVEGASLRHWRCVPPLLGLAFEVDCRRISRWEWVDA